MQLQELINAGQVNADNIHDLIPLMMQAGYSEQAAEKLADDYKDGKITNQDLAQDVDETRQTLQQEIVSLENEQKALNDALEDVNKELETASPERIDELVVLLDELDGTRDSFNKEKAVDLEIAKINLTAYEARQNDPDFDEKQLQRDLIAKIEDSELRGQVSKTLKLEEWQEQKPAQISCAPN